MAETKVNKVAISTVISLVTLIGGGYAWELSRQETVVQEVTQQMVMGDVELDLKRVELELKLLRTIKERRPLTEDEKDRYEYLKSLRTILKEKQKKSIA